MSFEWHPAARSCHQEVLCADALLPDSVLAEETRGLHLNMHRSVDIVCARSLISPAHMGGT